VQKKLSRYLPGSLDIYRPEVPVNIEISRYLPVNIERSLDIFSLDIFRDTGAFCVVTVSHLSLMERRPTKDPNL
jgi:hypothetical protein